MTRHHVVVCRNDTGVGWEMLERAAGASEWVKLSFGNPTFSRLLEDALVHGSRTWSADRIGAGPDLTITFSEAHAIRAMPPLDDIILVEGLLHDVWRSSLSVLLPIGDDTTPEQWATLIRPGFCGELIPAGIFNGLSLLKEVRALFASNGTLEKFEMRGGTVPSDALEEIWIRPRAKARTLLPEKFPEPRGRSPEAQAAFDRAVAANRARRAGTKKNDAIRVRESHNAEAIARSEARSEAWHDRRLKQLGVDHNG